MGSCHWKATWKDTQGSSAVDHMALLGTTAQVRTFQSIFSLFGISVLPFLFLSFLSFLFCFSLFLSTILPFFFFLSLFSKTEKFPALLGLCWMIDQSVCVPMQLHVSEISMYQWLSFSFCVETQNAGCLPVLRRYICTLKCEVNEVNEENQLA